MIRPDLDPDRPRTEWRHPKRLVAFIVLVYVAAAVVATVTLGW